MIVNKDMRDPITKGFPQVQLLITDTPNLPWMPKAEIERGLNQYSKFIRLGIVCFDDRLDLVFPHIKYSHDFYAKHLLHFLYTSIDRYTQPGDIVFDPFCGYSTAGICAINLRRIYIGYEINPEIHAESMKRLANGILR